MKDESYNLWDIILKIAGALAVTVGIIIGLWQYEATTERQFKEKFWEQQLNLYLEASKAAATLATIPKIEEDPIKKLERDKAQTRFWQLYYGELALIEDKDVEQAMIEFGNCLRQYEIDNCDPHELRGKSLKLASMCRQSIGKSWRLRLDRLQIDSEEGRQNK